MKKKGKYGRAPRMTQHSVGSDTRHEGRREGLQDRRNAIKGQLLLRQHRSVCRKVDVKQTRTRPADSVITGTNPSPGHLGKECKREKEGDTSAEANRQAIGQTSGAQAGIGIKKTPSGYSNRVSFAGEAQSNRPERHTEPERRQTTQVLLKKPTSGGLRTFWSTLAWLCTNMLATRAV